MPFRPGRWTAASAFSVSAATPRMASRASARARSASFWNGSATRVDCPPARLAAQRYCEMSDGGPYRVSCQSA